MWLWQCKEGEVCGHLGHRQSGIYYNRGIGQLLARDGSISGVLYGLPIALLNIDDVPYETWVIPD